METELRTIEEAPQVNIHPDALKEYQNGKRLAFMAYTDFGIENSPPSTTDSLPK